MIGIKMCFSACLTLAWSSSTNLSQWIAACHRQECGGVGVQACGLRQLGPSHRRDDNLEEGAVRLHAQLLRQAHSRQDCRKPQGCHPACGGGEPKKHQLYFLPLYFAQLQSGFPEAFTNVSSKPAIILMAHGLSVCRMVSQNAQCVVWKLKGGQPPFPSLSFVLLDKGLVARTINARTVLLCRPSNSLASSVA